MTFWQGFCKTNINQQVSVHAEARSLDEDGMEKQFHLSMAMYIYLEVIRASFIVLKDTFIAFPLTFSFQYTLINSGSR